MCNAIRAICAPFLLLIFVVVCAGSEAIAQSAAWRVSKSSGEVWVSTSGVQQASLTDDAVLNSGDNIRTGRNGRVLLVRGQEQILISPNSVISLPATKSPGSTTVIQQSGTILIEVEKRNMQHFEVETPYLAAVVKGTQFRVSVGQGESYVTVLGGQVDVTDFRSGQSALVHAGTDGEGRAGWESRSVTERLRHFEPHSAGHAPDFVGGAHSGSGRGPVRPR